MRHRLAALRARLALVATATARAHPCVARAPDLPASSLARLRAQRGRVHSDVRAANAPLTRPRSAALARTRRRAPAPLRLLLCRPLVDPASSRARDPSSLRLIAPITRPWPRALAPSAAAAALPHPRRSYCRRPASWSCSPPRPVLLAALPRSGCRAPSRHDTTSDCRPTALPSTWPRPLRSQPAPLRRPPRCPIGLLPGSPNRAPNRIGAHAPPLDLDAAWRYSTPSSSSTPSPEPRAGLPPLRHTVPVDHPDTRCPEPYDPPSASLPPLSLARHRLPALRARLALVTTATARAHPCVARAPDLPASSVARLRAHRGRVHSDVRTPDAPLTRPRSAALARTRRRAPAYLRLLLCRPHIDPASSGARGPSSLRLIAPVTRPWPRALAPSAATAALPHPCCSYCRRPASWSCLPPRLVLLAALPRSGCRAPFRRDTTSDWRPTALRSTWPRPLRSQLAPLRRPPRCPIGLRPGSPNRASSARAWLRPAAATPARPAKATGAYDMPPCANDGWAIPRTILKKK
nr:proline-rich protein 36-like [Aegilops tauschii subsp. strangulata]